MRCIQRPLSTRLLRVLLASVLIAAIGTACEEEKKDDGDSKPEKKPTAELITGDAPTLPDELSKLEFGMTLGEAREALEIGEKEIFDSTQFQDVSWILHYDPRNDDEVDGIVASFDLDNARDVITKKWGEPVELESLGRPLSVWYAPERNLRAGLEAGPVEGNWDLEFERYLSLEGLIGEKGGPLGFEKKETPILGSSPKKLLEAYPEHASMVSAEEDARSKEEIKKLAPEAEGVLGDAEAHVQFQLLPTTYDTGTYTPVTLHLDDESGVYRSYSISLTLPQVGQKKLDELLTAKYGEPKIGEDLDKEVKLYFSPEYRQRIMVRPGLGDENARSIEVDQYLPLAELVGEGGKMSFEGETPWVGNLTEEEFAEIKSEKYDWLELPPVEYADGATHVWPEFDDGKAVGYRLSIDYDLVPDAGDEILETFKAKLGEPTEGKTKIGDRTTYTFETDPPVVIEAQNVDSYTVRVGSR